MCKTWKKEKCNHHFPELNKKVKLFNTIKSVFSWRLASVLLVIVTVVFGLSYLMQTNFVATKGYQIKDLEQRVEELKNNSDQLNLQYIELQSMASITKNVKNMDLIATNDVEIITPLGSAMALR
ncbi:MAG TPA: hypothetical protein VJB67_01745 [Patescibacteria group bacterium]|nr:hypothetical protein [Patescibacteria group bacterium]